MKKYWLILVGFLLVVFCLRVLLLYFWPFPIAGEEPFEAMMAKKIALNPAFYVGWPSQNYMGSQGFYWLAFWGQILGWQLESTRLATFLLIFCLTLLLTAVTYRRYGPTAALLVIALFPWQTAHANTLQFYYLSYHPALTIIAIALLLKTWMPVSRNATPCWWLLLGWLSGLAVWSNEFAIIFLTPLLLSNEPRRWIHWRGLPWLAAGLVLGYLPRIIYLLLIDDSGVDRLALMAAGAKETQAAQTSIHSLEPLLPSFLDKLTYRWSQIVQVYGYPLIIIFAVACLLFIIQTWRQRGKLRLDWLGKGILVTLVLLLLEGNKNRYLAISLPYFTVLTAYLISACPLPPIFNHRRLAIFLLVGGLLFSYLSATRSYEPGAMKPLQELTNTIRTNHYTTGISGYDTAQLVMYEMADQPEPVSVSSLGGPVFNSRFIDKELAVASNGAQFVVYLVTDAPELKTALTNYLTATKIEWREETIAGTYNLYHQFTQPVFPGSYLPPNSNWQKRFSRFTPTNPRRLNQEAANQLHRYHPPSAGGKN